MNLVMEKTERAASIKGDPRWTSLLARDSRADGTFYYSVETTGVYCRPSCAARLPRPENVKFYETRRDAEAAGFRPCRRCKPDQPSLAEQHASTIAKACRIIENAEEMPALHSLAEEVGMSAYHLHRVFKAVTGVTPKDYAIAHRNKRVRTTLGSEAKVTDAIYEAGFNSNSRFYESSNQILGMTPTDFRNGGARTDIRFAVGECSLGSILVAATERGVCAILLGDDPDALTRDLQDRFPNANLIGGETEFERIVAKVVGFVEAPQTGIHLPLDIRGTAFQQQVWQALQQIPAGTTISYAELAARIGQPKAVRGVAQACAANVLAVAIPCHRVVRNDGGLAGYRWGVERKRALLKREARAHATD